MADRTELTPAELRATARHLDDVSSRMKGVVSNVHGLLNGEGSPWGGSKDGVEFAQGDKGYIAQVTWVDGSVDAKTSLLDAYSKGINSTANNLEATDQA